MKILSIASEVFPLVKTGGLADVAGALPGALAALGQEVRTLLPGYPPVMAKVSGVTELHAFGELYGGTARLLAAKCGGLDLFLLDAPHLYERHGNIYLGPDNADWSDNAFRFAALSWAGGFIGKGHLAAFQPDVVHAHDWQAGLVPAYLRYGSEARAARSVMTIHNIAFQGFFPASLFPRLDLPSQAFSMDGIEYYGGISYLKAGLAHADAITTVSPSYAREIATAEFGMGLDGLIRYRAGRLHGIVNGIDMNVWNPASDPHLPKPYSINDLSGRAACKSALEARFKLEGDGPIMTVISRLTWQKGLDLLADSIDEIAGIGCRLALLGSGEQSIERRFQDAAERYPGRVGLQLGYDEALAHLIQAGGDAILVPSRFEPCGLTQLCALRYGSVPVVSRVGGLNDTIIDANDAALSAAVATGFQFSPVNREELMYAISRMLALYAVPANWERLVKNGMASDVSWMRSAERYAGLYKSLIS